MKRLNIAISILLWGVFSLQVQGQDVFTSPISQTWPTIFNTHFEDVERSLAFHGSEISLMTTVKNGKEIVRYKILEYQEGEGGITILSASMDESDLITIVIPAQERIEIIDIFRPHPKTGEVEQIRLWID